MSPQTSDTIGGIVCLIVALLLLAWGRRERRKEAAHERHIDEAMSLATPAARVRYDDRPLFDVIASRMARDLDAEWRRLATLPAREWPSGAGLPRTW